MNQAQNTKFVAINADLTVDDAAFATTPIDTLGYDYCQIVLHFGDVPADVAEIKVQECDEVGGTYADVVGTDVGTDANSDGDVSALPADGDDNAVVVIELDLRDRQRFLDLAVTAGDGSGSPTEMSAVALLSRAKVDPVAVADRGVAEVLRV